MSQSGMTLPEGMRCGDCLHFKRCVALFQCPAANTECDWSPSRFIESESSKAERLLTESRLAAIKAEELTLAQQSLVNHVEEQRDYAENLLLSLLTEARPYLKDSPAYALAMKHMREVSTMDKYERRLA
jgi:hypothetical protein